MGMAMRVRIRPPKIRPPRLMPRRPQIIVGIPTYNEAKNIENITKVIDKGLYKYFSDKKALIVDVDSNSPDKTRKIFLSTKTKTPKHYLKSPRGKGAAIKNLLKYFLDTESAEVLIIIDANANGASPRWIRNLGIPILKGFDHVFPEYNGHEYDASVTNHFCYPVMRGVLGIDLRRPVTGQSAMSKKAVDRLYHRSWPASAMKNGVDILAALSSTFGELRIAKSYLGDLPTNSDTDKITEYFEDRAATLFEKLDKRPNILIESAKIRKPPLFFKGSRKSKSGTAHIDYKALSSYSVKEFNKNKADIKRIVGAKSYKNLSTIFKTKSRLDLGANDWTEIVYKFVGDLKASPIKRAKALRPLYLARYLTFYKDYLDKSHKDSEQAIVDQADLFYKRRNLLFS